MGRTEDPKALLPSRRATLFVGSLALWVILLPAIVAQAGPGDSRCAEIHDALKEAGVPVDTVRQEGENYYVLLPSDCPAELVRRAEEIKAKILSAPEPKATVVDNLYDALVVIRFEPENESAKKILRERYETLKKEQR